MKRQKKKFEQEERRGLDEKGVFRRIKIKIVNYPNDWVEIYTDYPILLEKGTIKFQNQVNLQSEEVIIMNILNETEWWRKIAILEWAIDTNEEFQLRKLKLQIKNSTKVLIKKGTKVGICFLKKNSTEESENKKEIIYFDV